MTIAELIDYLQEFPPETKVVLSEADMVGPGSFIDLGMLDFK